MIKIENVEVMGWEAAIRGMRNPLNSWQMSDSIFVEDGEYHDICNNSGPYNGSVSDTETFFEMGPKDYDLMTRLRNAGADHRKFMRMIAVYLDITAPLYWWKEFDTYKVGTTANSCSTMHKIADKEFTLDDFSHDHLTKFIPGQDLNGWTLEENDLITLPNDLSYGYSSIGILRDIIIKALNFNRERYLETKDKKYWWQMIQLLPSSYNQKRTVMLNYEVLANIYKSRKNHKLDEWVDLCKWIETLPYSELITGENTSLINKFVEAGNVYPITSEELSKALNEKENTK